MHRITEPKRSAWRYLQVTGVILAVLALTLPVNAATPGFLPGDAYFGTLLDQKLADRLGKDSENLVLDYYAPIEWFALCGYHGFWNLELKNLDQRTAKNISSLYNHLRTELGHDKMIRVRRTDTGEIEERETNPFLLLIMNKDFDQRRFRIGLKYNESWMEVRGFSFTGEQAETPPDSPSSAKYCSLIKGETAAVEDWRNARAVHPLKVLVPDGINWKQGGGRMIETPVSVDCSQVTFLIIPKEALQDVFKRKIDVPYYAVTGDTVEEVFWKRERGETTLTREPVLFETKK